MRPWILPIVVALACVAFVALREDKTADTTALEAEVMGRLRRLDRWLLRRTLRSARLHMRWRERAKTNIVRAIHGARLSAKELDRRLVARGASISFICARISGWSTCLATVSPRLPAACAGTGLT